jgi:uncharacterized membrane-anchored protein YhcB (DUF1043 family)
MNIKLVALYTFGLLALAQTQETHAANWRTPFQKINSFYQENKAPLFGSLGTACISWGLCKALHDTTTNIGLYIAASLPCYWLALNAKESRSTAKLNGHLNTVNEQLQENKNTLTQAQAALNQHITATAQQRDTLAQRTAIRTALLNNARLINNERLNNTYKEIDKLKTTLTQTHDALNQHIARAQLLNNQQAEQLTENIAVLRGRIQNINTTDAVVEKIQHNSSEQQQALNNSFAHTNACIEKVVGTVNNNARISDAHYIEVTTCLNIQREATGHLANTIEALPTRTTVRKMIDLNDSLRLARTYTQSKNK